MVHHADIKINAIALLADHAAHQKFWLCALCGLLHAGSDAAFIAATINELDFLRELLIPKPGLGHDTDPPAGLRPDRNLHGFEIHHRGMGADVVCRKWPAIELARINLGLIESGAIHHQIALDALNPHRFEPLGDFIEIFHHQLWISAALEKKIPAQYARLKPSGSGNARLMPKLRAQ